FHSNDRIALAAQDWYMKIGNGISLRNLSLPFLLTKRAAHFALTEVPSHYSVEEGWRWAQVVSMGGSETIARAIIGTRLGESFVDETFWETVIRFIIDHPVLAPAQIGPLIDYLWYERYTPRRVDEPYRLPVDFVMKGRTPAALLAC